MNDPHRTDADDAVRAQAIHWFSRLQLGRLGPDERVEYEAWRAAHPANDRQLRVLESIWSAADHLPRESMRAVLRQQEPARTPSLRRRAWIWGFGATCTAVMAASLLAPKWGGESPIYATELTTLRGERRELRLPDGSMLFVNTDSRVAVEFHADRRMLRLDRGEVMVKVRHDPAKPFTVVATQGRVADVAGSVFDVRLEGDRLAVAVTSGSVRLSADGGNGGRVDTVVSGHVASLDSSGPQPSRSANIADLTAWQRGRLVFRDEPLDTVVSELNRYLQQPLRIEDDRLNSVRIAATFGIDDPLSILDALPTIASIQVRREADGQPVLSRLRDARHSGDRP